MSEATGPGPGAGCVRPASVRPASEEVRALRVLHTVTQQVHASLDLAETLHAVARGVLEATCFGLVVINLRWPTGEYEVVTVEGDDTARAQLLGLVEPEHRWRELLERGEPWGRLRFIHHTQADVEVDPIYLWVPPFAPSTDPEDWHPHDALFAPLIAPSGTVLGALSVDLPAGGRRPTRAQCEVLEMFADHAAIAIEHARLTAELRLSHDEQAHAAHHDPLTGVANRALLMHRGTAAAATPGGLLGLLVLDLDGFKAVNDAAGHHVGDHVLHVLATRMQSCVRPQDLLARTGGDEFVVLMSLPTSTDTTLPHTLADRLRAVCSDPVVVHGRRHQLGVSVGVAITPTPTPFEDVLAAADTAMYTEKRTHRAANAAGSHDSLIEVGHATLATARITLILAGLHAQLVGTDIPTNLGRHPSVLGMETKVAARLHLKDPLRTTVTTWVSAATTLLTERHTFLHGPLTAATTPHTTTDRDPRNNQPEAHYLPNLRELTRRLHITVDTGDTVLHHTRTDKDTTPPPSASEPHPKVP